ncbi:hypothetical protein SERLA73DRAFT_134913 [Serpula lacrymans var. lacrymans S7.3]|uniref:DUF6533 domain-containing protein n=2 Tax=Serpula lacrymans var. lacrymans TaxID=341189 RepID=F8PTZ0_SERL3|nr:uncharacterized protein SERLADRAFT_386684 [Serpula lacrymans var. lacrymans S7.9]EGN99615.1 hypothetical protein SERLA73DRAFT_134913 [Serpula lacrymans var. lacrymans S7.3]EGO25181.1 hypothetical protein SERLADRAFT_386684 [Serpula lacrymans var. lacrymans S7.9]
MASPVYLPPATISLLQATQGDADVVRYLSAAGLVILLYDHLLTFADEVALIWTSSRSFAKYLYLMNRYLVPQVLIVTAYQMCGFSGYQFTDERCRVLLSISSILAIISISIANLLVLIRVAMLWDNDRSIVFLLSAGFLASFSVTISMMALTLYRTWYGIEYSTIAKMCAVTNTSPALIAVWAAPLLFELVVLAFTVVNAIARPRRANLMLVKALRRDGIMFFIAIACLRILNLALAATRKSALVLLAVYFVWSMVTLILNRSLLNLRRADVLEALRQAPPLDPRSMSPFGALPNADELPDVEYELEERRVPKASWLDSKRKPNPPSRGPQRTQSDDALQWDWKANYT